MKAAFTAAAKLMLESPGDYIEGACVAIDVSCLDAKTSQAMASPFRKMFLVDGAAGGNTTVYFLGESQPRKATAESRRTRELRVYALLLAANAWRDFV